jgi:hypothetical protein
MNLKLCNAKVFVALMISAVGVWSANAQTTLCNTTSPPSLSAIAAAITTTSNGQTSFVTNYDTLSQGAWCTFIALNWAAKGNNPTMTADPTKKIGTCAIESQNCPVVWETWTDSNSIFQPNGATPAVCGSAKAVNTVRTPLVHKLLGFVPNEVKTYKPGATDSQSIDEFKQATGFQLPDKNNSSTNPSVILYEVRENPSLAGAICSNSLYNLNGQYAFYQKANPPQGGQPPSPTGLQFSGSAFEVKPAWYATATSEPDQLGMLTAQGQCVPGVTCGQSGTFNIGLGGFHILWKVFTNSTWYWMTFEYVNPSGTDNTTIAPVLKSAIPTAYFPFPKGKTKTNFGPFVPSTPSPSSVATAAANANAVFQPLLKGTRLANYKLVAVQVQPVLSGQNTLLANNVIETDFGSPGYNQSNLNPSSSCISCHYAASIGPLTTSPSCSLDRINFFAPPAFVSGLQGAFDPTVYAAGTGQTAGYISSDFVWTLRKAQWNSTGSGCPPASSAAKPKAKSK